MKDTKEIKKIKKIIRKWKKEAAYLNDSIVRIGLGWGRHNAAIDLMRHETSKACALTCAAQELAKEFGLSYEEI